jgi:hypothetical protein
LSYDISLYRTEFLRHAIEQNLGVWSRADSIPEADVMAIVEWLKTKGYVQGFGHPDLGVTYSHPRSDWAIQVGVHRGCIAFTVAYGNAALSAVAAALADARELMELGKLALYDPQSGEIEEAPEDHPQPDPPHCGQPAG